METEILKPTEAALLKLLEIQWQDHFQTRNQTWKALEITILIAIVLVVLDRQFSRLFITAIVTSLLVVISLLGMQITLRHRNKSEITNFIIIQSVSKKLEIMDAKLELPKPIYWWDIFLFWKANTPLFILRIYFVILLFAIIYFLLRFLSA